ncbi:MAG: hypothetical protein KF799_04650 [Bdellovibrionales bacterium]|nr:hypothetical protein [Bdellovibrionales bacterium]
MLLLILIVMVETNSPPFFETPEFADLIGRGLAMAALFGSLVAMSGLVDSMRLRLEMKPLITSYTISCSPEKKETVDQAGEGCHHTTSADEQLAARN